MTRKELQTVLKVLEKIKNPDSWVQECIHTIKRDIERYNKRRGQLREMNDYEIPW